MTNRVPISAIMVARTPAQNGFLIPTNKWLAIYLALCIVPVWVFFAATENIHFHSPSLLSPHSFSPIFTSRKTRPPPMPIIKMLQITNIPKNKNANSKP